MTVKGAFTVELSGPYEARAALLDAFARESIAAHYKNSPSPNLDEEAKGWIDARFHEGTDSPSADFQRDCLAKAQALGEQFGYEMRSYGVVVGAAAQLSHIIDKRTGELVMKAFNVTEENLSDLARAIGLPAEFLELREPPGLWDVPEA
ncbi:hypothetical protein [Streptomyces sp. SGAir0924]|uniref:hypothetical protein n=1 Tax=Streptomyces sp. SGAir0924 TaxID=2109593 RepID=UPI0010CD1B37|nr:hypothetical protein [Streptomyces sp. SGAir0924]QCR49838.1 hypothetical protein C1N79_26285 [Streptomyces sp. SGAir0924]